MQHWFGNELVLHGVTAPNSHLVGHLCQSHGSLGAHVTLSSAFTYATGVLSNSSRLSLCLSVHVKTIGTRGTTRIELATSRTQSENHTTRPRSHVKRPIISKMMDTTSGDSELGVGVCGWPQGSVWCVYPTSMTHLYGYLVQFRTSACLATCSRHSLLSPRCSSGHNLQQTQGSPTSNS